MSRLFVAIDLPEAVKDELADMCHGVAGARWVRREQMHLTLRFIGDVGAARQAAIKTALSAIQPEPFDLRLAGVGRFPPGKKAARVLWVGLDVSRELKAMHAAVEAALATVAIEPEERPFRPHITLARLKSPDPYAVNRFLGRHAAFDCAAIAVREFVLFSSELHPEGAHYKHEAVYPLKDASI